MIQAGFHHANALASTINENIQTQISSRDSEILALLQNIPSLVSTPSSSSENSTQEPTSQAQLSHQANVTINDNVQLQILQLLKELARDVKQNQPRRSQPRPARKTPDGKNSPPRADTSKYCWTHGAGNHSSAECNRRAVGHKREATLTNKLGGSTAYCA